MKNMNQHIRKSLLLASVACVFALTGCISRGPLTDEEMRASEAADRPLMFADTQPLLRPISLAEAVTRVLSTNLDRRARIMEEALAQGQYDVSRFDLLPKMSLEGGYVGRSDHATTTSRDSITLQPALSNPYYSMDRNRGVADFALSWNVLDFGVSWYSAKQNADRALIATERRRKAVASLIQDVRTAYWRAVAAQKLEASVADAIKQSEIALKSSERVEAEKLRDPQETLRFRKNLLENMRLLGEVHQELSVAKAELAALISLPPGTPFRLEDPSEDSMKLHAWKMPVEKMEEMAFLNNPDLREHVYQTRIAVDETRKAILKILPGITFAASRNYDSNSFLMSNYWNEASAKLSFNLVNILSAPSQIAFADANEDVANAKRLALRMAVLAQVHVSRLQYEQLSRQYDLADKLAKVERKLAVASASRQANDAQSRIEAINNKISSISAELRRYQAFARAEAALGKMHAALGVDFMPTSDAPMSFEEINKSLADKLKAYDMGDIPLPALPAAETAQPENAAQQAELTAAVKAAE